VSSSNPYEAAPVGENSTAPTLKSHLPLVICRTEQENPILVHLAEGPQLQQESRIPTSTPADQQGHLVRELEFAESVDEVSPLDFFWTLVINDAFNATGIECFAFLHALRPFMVNPRLKARPNALIARWCWKWQAVQAIGHRAKAGAATFLWNRSTATSKAKKTPSKSIPPHDPELLISPPFRSLMVRHCGRISGLVDKIFFQEYFVGAGGTSKTRYY
jgi:hypothetical protein